MKLEDKLPDPETFGSKPSPDTRNCYILVLNVAKTQEQAFDMFQLLIKRYTQRLPLLGEFSYCRAFRSFVGGRGNLRGNLRQVGENGRCVSDSQKVGEITKSRQKSRDSL